jgi:phosphoribosyl 1,2-cyclic phosphodiesterase
MRAQLCGVRGGTPAPGIEFARYGGHTSCVELTHSDRREPSLILDAGTGIRAAAGGQGGGAFAGTLLLTHLHWDHVQGLPFFPAGDREDARTSLLLPEQEDGSGAVDVLARAVSPPHFPISPTQLRGDWSFALMAEGQHEIEGFTVLAREIPHKGGRTFGYRISDGSSTLVYMPDHCPTMLGPGPDGFGEYHPAAIELASGADVLIHDGQLFGEELAAEAKFGHAVVDYPIALAARAGARSVVLFHHRYDRTDEQLDAIGTRLQEHAGVSLAVQGSTLEL